MNSSGEAPQELRRHVLLLDDDRDFADSVGELLRLEGYQVTVVYDPDNARVAIAQDPPQVMLIDLRLDCTNGITAVRALRAERPEILPVVITAYASLETGLEALKAGAYEYLRKPIHTGELLSTLDRCFEHHRLATERAEALSQLARSEERLRQLIEHSTSAITFEDFEGRTLLSNERFRCLFRRSGHEPLITSPSEEATVRAGGTICREIIVGSEHDTKRALVTRFPVFNESHEPIGIGMIATDVTERRRTEERLRQAQRLEALGRLTSGVAHDFNNLLSVILGNLRLLEEELQGRQDLLEIVRDCIGATLGGSDLTSRLLAIGQGQQLKPEVTDLAEVLTGMVRMLRRILGENIEIQLDLGPQLSNVRIDRAQFESCILNLAINSRDAMPMGGRLILAASNTVVTADAALPGVSPGSYVEFMVRDSGIGMPPEIVERALQPFFTTKPISQGSGLGLSIVHGFVGQSGGHLEIASVVGKGTTVTIRFPRCEAVVSDSEQVSSVECIRSAKGEHILVVEDQMAIRKWLSRQLRRLGYHVYEAAEFRAASDYLATTVRIDLVLTDVALPGVGDGLDVCRIAQRRRPAPAVVLMTGHAALMPDDLGGELVQVPLMRKPLEPIMLARTLRAALDQHGETNT